MTFAVHVSCVLWFGQVYVIVATDSDEWFATAERLNIAVAKGCELNAHGLPFLGDLFVLAERTATDLGARYANHTNTAAVAHVP